MSAKRVRSVVRVVVGAAVVGAVAVGCGQFGAQHTSREQEKQLSSDPTDQAELIFNRGLFRRYLNPEASDDAQLLRYLLIQMAPDENNPEERVDLGYLREERLVVKIKPWDERSDSGFIVRVPGSFKFAARESDGSVRLYEAVDKTYWTVTDLAGKPVGIVDEFGTVFRYDDAAGRSVEIGTGDARRAAEILFDVRPHVYLDEENVRRVIVTPIVFLRELDSNSAEERFVESTQPLDEIFTPDPLYHDKDRIWNR